MYRENVIVTVEIEEYPANSEVMTASEARKKAESVRSGETTKALAAALEFIKTRAGKGYFDGEFRYLTDFGATTRPAVCDALRALGYTVSAEYAGQSVWHINW